MAALVERVPAELWGGRLALHLLAHRALGDHSPFATYIDALPVTHVGVPLFFGGAAIDALQVLLKLHPDPRHAPMHSRQVQAKGADTVFAPCSILPFLRKSKCAVVGWQALPEMSLADFLALTRIPSRAKPPMPMVLVSGLLVD